MSKHQKHLVDFRKVKDSVSIKQVLEHYGILGSFSKRSNAIGASQGLQVLMLLKQNPIDQPLDFPWKFFEKQGKTTR